MSFPVKEGFKTVGRFNFVLFPEIRIYSTLLKRVAQCIVYWDGDALILSGIFGLTIKGYYFIRMVDFDCDAHWFAHFIGK